MGDREVLVEAKKQSLLAMAHQGHHLTQPITKQSIRAQPDLRYLGITLF